MQKNVINAKTNFGLKEAYFWGMHFWGKRRARVLKKKVH